MSKPPRPKKLGGLELIAQYAVDEAHAQVMRTWDMALGDSPIERIFYTALVAHAPYAGRVIDNVSRVLPGKTAEYMRSLSDHMGEGSRTAHIEPQVLVAGWRVDFVVHYPSIEGSGELRRLIVECDGHDFHERTRDQAARDRSRDRLAQYEGIPVLRFTGSEIWNDPIECADEVFAFMERH